MAIRKPLARRAGAGVNHDVRTAEEYVDQVIAAEEADLSPDEIDALRASVEDIRQGRMTLEEFERKHGF
jgi:hypothetical protein